MINTVYKYEIPLLGDPFALRLPKNAEVLCTMADQKTDRACMWIKQATSPTGYTNRIFFVANTGQWIEEDTTKYVYIGSFQIDKGQYIGHLFEIIE